MRNNNMCHGGECSKVANAPRSRYWLAKFTINAESSGTRRNLICKVLKRHVQHSKSIIKMAKFVNIITSKPCTRKTKRKKCNNQTTGNN